MLIYNGGIEEWRKNGLPLVREKPLPEAEVAFMETELLYQRLQEVNATFCREKDGQRALTILDFRVDNYLEPASPPPAIVTVCPVVILQLDDLLRQQVRASIPRDHPVVTLTETGNRDEFAIRYLSQFGFDNLHGLEFGMRGWLKHRYPTR